MASTSAGTSTAGQKLKIKVNGEKLKDPWESQWSRLLDSKLREKIAADLKNPVPEPVYCIFRVREQVRDMKPELFEPSILRMGLLHRKRFETFRLEKAEEFSLEMAIKFLECFPYSVKRWDALSKFIVPDPNRTKSTDYKLDFSDDLSDDTVRNALTLDAIILVQFVLRNNFVDSKGDRSFQDMLFLDIIKLENQIPLQELRRAVWYPFGHTQQRVWSDDAYGDILVNQLCSILMRQAGSSLPGLYGKLSHSSFLLPIELLEGCDHLLSWVCKAVCFIGPKSPARLDSQLRSVGRKVADGCVWLWVHRFDGQFPDSHHGPVVTFAVFIIWKCLLLMLFLILFLIFLMLFLIFLMLFLIVIEYMWPVLFVLIPIIIFEWLRLKRQGRLSAGLSHKVHNKSKIPSVAKLQEVGVQFKGVTSELGESYTGLVPKFEVGLLTVTLYIPSFSIESFTEILWRNMIAYAVTKEETADFISFMQFMGEMIDSKEDVEILRNGFPSVIRQSSFDEDKKVVNLFQSLLQHHGHPHTHGKWDDLRKRILDYYYGGGGQSLCKAFARFVEPYEKNPFLYGSLLAALSLGVLQFCYIIFSVVFMIGRPTKT